MSFEKKSYILATLHIFSLIVFLLLSHIKEGFSQIKITNFLIFSKSFIDLYSDLGYALVALASQEAGGRRIT